MKKHILLFLMITSIVKVQSQNTSSKSAYEGVKVEMLASKSVNEEYKIITGFPLAFNPNKEYQVLYVLDADVTFGMVNDIVRLLSFEGKIAPVIVVGIAYPSLREWLQKRGRDYMPNYGKESSDQEVKKFHQFISEELIPHINKTYKVKATENILYGHSSGGLFGLYSLFKDPNLFKNYILTSPSVDEDKEFTFALEKSFASVNNSLEAYVYTSVASKDKVTFIGEYQKFINLVNTRKYKGFHTRNETIVGTHMSSMAQAFINGLYFINQK